VADERNFCSDCHDDLPWIESACPPRAALFEAAVAPLRYEFPIDAAIKALKFKRRLFYAPALAEILCMACGQLPTDISAVLPVPLHWRRKAFRGFNQALELARPVAKFLKVPIVRGVYRKHATPFQSGLAAAARNRNLRRAFAVRKTCPHDHVLIVDDVITTGATMRSLARVMLTNGAQRVSVLTVARAG